MLIQEAIQTHHSWHYVLELLGGGATLQWLFSCFVSTMPPYAGSNYFIKWVYAFLHVVAANMDKVHIPGSPADIAAGAKDKSQ